MGMSAGRQGDAMAEINVTPLVDVMLVLLVIFMVTAPLMEPESGVTVDLPQAVADDLPTPADTELRIVVDADRAVFLGGDRANRYTFEELPPKLRAIAEANPDQPVYVEADGALPYRDVATLLAMAKAAGMPRVGLVFDPSPPNAGTPGAE